MFQALVFLLVSLDITLDIVEGLPMKAMIYDLLLEGSILVLVILSTNSIWRKLKVEKESKSKLENRLNETVLKASIWEKKSKDFVSEFHSHLLSKFFDWSLSKSEKEVAVLLLKGLTSKEIASIRFTSERTIRNQCRSIYEKAGFKSKNELKGYFLSELIVDLDHSKL